MAGDAIIQAGCASTGRGQAEPLACAERCQRPVQVAARSTGRLPLPCHRAITQDARA